MPGNKVKLSSKNLEMPPLQEWLEFQAEQLKSASEFLCTDIKNIVTEVVQKNKGELSKEDYKSYKISSLAMRQFRQSIEKTIANLTEMVSQADAELAQRFEKNSEEIGSGSGDESEINRTSDGGQKEDDERSVGEDGGADSDGSCTTADGSSPEKNTKGESRDESFFEDDHLSMQEEEEEEMETTTVSKAGNEESSVNEVDATVETVNGVDIEEGRDAEKKKEGEEEEDVFIKRSSSLRVVRSPSPADTVFMTPPSKSASNSVQVVRSPSPAETVALFSSPKKSKETPAEKRISRRRRSPSPAGTVLINRKKTDDSDDEDASARRSVLSSSPKTPDENPKGRSSRRSPSPADTVMLGRRNKQASDSDDEDSKARRSVLSSSSSKDRKRSKRSPSPADTVMLSRKKNGLSDSDDEDAEARRSVLSSGSKSSVNAPFKKPRAVSSKVSSEDEQVTSNSSGAAADKSEPMEVDQVPAKWQDDPKLKRNACKVQVERLEKVILDKLETQGFVYVYPKNKKSKKKDDDEDILDRAIKRLVNLNPIVSTSPRRRGRSKKPQTKSEKKKRKESGSDDDEDARARDDSADGVSDDDEPVLTRAVRPLTKSVSKDDDEESHGSDDEELEGKKESVSDDEDRYAREKILKGARKIVTVSSSDEKDEKDAKTSKSQDKKEKRKSYYTPQVNVKSKDTSDEDSDDDFVAPKKKIKTRGRGTIRSDSEESRSSKEQNNKTDKRYSTEELSSDSESQQPVAKLKRRRLSSREEDKKSKPKRRRVKTLSDSDSDDSDAPKKKSKKKKKKDDEEVVIDSDSDIEVTKDDTETKGRKKIRGIISKSDLQKETRKAEKEEEERRKRIAERQSKFNGIFKPPEGESLTELVLDFDQETKKPLVVVDPEITKKLKRHQADGIRFMWQSCFESVEQFKKPNNPGSGCILAHCMGLGKTLQTVAFLHTVMTSETIGLKTALVICPLNTVTNWSNEVKMWTRNADKQVYVHALYDGKNQDQKISDLKYWMRKGGVGIIHYDSFRALVEGKQKKKLKDVIMECLVDPGADIVVCDEGHVFKNDKSKMAQAVNKIRTLRRVVLTGTPLQNNLKEYHCMMQFVKPNLLGSKKEFLNRFVNPITNGQHKDSTAGDVKLMKKRAHVLHKLLDGCVQRLDYSVLVPYLPPKHEYVISIRMTDIQNKLYCHYLESIKSVNDMKALVKQLLKHAANLAKVYCHPKALELKHAQKMDYDDEGEISSGAGSLKDFIDDDSTEESSVEISDSADDSEIDWLDEDGSNKIEKKKKKQEKNKTKELAAVKLEKNGEGEGNEGEKEEEVNELSGDIIENGGNWWTKFFKSKDEMSLMEHSTKMVVLFEILKTCESIQDKVLVFSQNLYSLDLIEEFLGALDDEARSRDNKPKTFPPTDDPDVSRWRRNIEYFRIDGSTKHHDRQRNCDTFNKKTDTSRAKLFLISTKAGGIGINLIGANRVVIFDASWNPSQDMQSIFRVFRFGQTKPCYVYRLLAKGTIEEKIYNRQVVKLALSGRVVDEHQIERHFTFDDIAKMFEYNPDEKTDCPTPDVPKDRLLADLLMSQKDVIYTYHEHDSLLQNQVDQGLTEDERKAAWEEYQNEKEHKVPNPDHVNDIQQAYDKMRAKIRLMYPNVSDGILNLYVRRIQHEMLELRKETAWFLENRGKMEIPSAVKYSQQLAFRKEQISKCFSVPGFLSNLMKPEIDKLIQRSNNALLQAQRNGLISIAKNIMEGQGGAGPSHMYQPNSNNVNFPQLFNNLMLQQQPQQQHRPAVQQQRPSIPTIPVPYHPSRDDDVVNLD